MTSVDAQSLAALADAIRRIDSTVHLLAPLKNRPFQKIGAPLTGDDGLKSDKAAEVMVKFLSPDDGSVMRALRLDGWARNEIATHLSERGLLAEIAGGSGGPIASLLLQPLGPIPGDHFAGFHNAKASEWTPFYGGLSSLYPDSPTYVLGAAHREWKNLICAEYGSGEQQPTGPNEPVLNEFMTASAEKRSAIAGKRFAEAFRHCESTELLDALTVDQAVHEEWAWVVGARPWLRELVSAASPQVYAWLEESPTFNLHESRGYSPGSTSGKTSENSAHFSLRTAEMSRNQRPGSAPHTGQTKDDHGIG